MEAVHARLRVRFPRDYKDAPITVLALAEDLQAAARPVLLVLLGASALVLAIACANLSGLLVVQATSRGRELAIRAALGASRRRLVGQLLIESALIAAAAAALGTCVALAIRDALVALAPPSIPRLDRCSPRSLPERSLQPARPRQICCPHFSTAAARSPARDRVRAGCSLRASSRLPWCC
jgi:hypothetical protein